MAERGEGVNFEGLISVITTPDRSKVLLLKRREDKLFGGEYAPVAAGPYTSTENFREKAIEETKAETGLDAKLLSEGPSFNLETEQLKAKVHPFLFEAAEESKVTLNDEHTESRWVPVNLLNSPDFDPRLTSFILAFISQSEKQ